MPSNPVHGLSEMWRFYKCLLNMLGYIPRGHALDVIIHINIS